MPPPRPPFQRDNTVRRTRINHMIRISPVRLIGPNDEMVGVVETHEALRQADAAGLDLVEISPDARPPVCKIMDYGKFKYEESKKAQKSRAASKSTEMKEVRLGRSVKIDPHDVQIRIDQSRRFLMAGHKVLVTQKFRGREIAHREIGLENLAKVRDQLADISKVEQTPRWMGKQASIILAPDKVKVEAIKRKLAKELAARQGISEEAAIKAQEEEAKKALAAVEAAVGPEDDDEDDED
ncbi:MAG TPA: translation initiation factor IF-3 [Phycisphaerales bacterium]|nr:translation initiation factor IF-3 [Phycisphaerales bacterium]